MNKKLVYGTGALLLVGLAVFFWKPKVPSLPSKKCGMENCSGLEVTCGPNIPKYCPEIYMVGSWCRQYASCQMIDGQCQLVKTAKFEACKTCIERCLKEFGDPMEVSQCDGECADKWTEEPKYCANYQGELLPNEDCADLPVGARKCSRAGECGPTCAHGCVNQSWEGDITDCEVIPEYECECIDDFCQVV